MSEEHARLRIDVFTLFPGMFAGPLDESILKRARAAGIVDVAIHDLRAWTHDRHHTADDTPYGGGPGMVMLAPPIVEGVEATLGPDLGRVPIRVMSAAGRLFTQDIALALAQASRLVLVCGHYEGIDQRAIELLDAEELSIGDYVLTGGELPAMVVIDAVCRLVPGAIDAASVEDESHAAGLLEYPHYTRPAVFRDLAVPPVLLSGHHAEIARWRRREAIARTARRRPDLLKGSNLSDAERESAANACRSVDESGAP
ncbi:MAG TPA: tRNA (guanosine(37)-N1)-methyltransferase TrmD [Thermomicrobiales bacterium]|nr:tRNA (guanosine(37)-N1)-methyltransferase TrmD [Thermomicrobiales bacterium]